MPVDDVFAESVSECPGYLAVGFLRGFIDIDFPADATGVAAAGGDTLELIVKIGLAE